MTTPRKPGYAEHMAAHRARIAVLHAAGASWGAIARTLHSSETAIRFHAKRMGLVGHFEFGGKRRPERLASLPDPPKRGPEQLTRSQKRTEKLQFTKIACASLALLTASPAFAGEFSDFLNGNTLSATVVRGVISQLGADDARTRNRLSNLSYSELRDLESRNLRAWNTRMITRSEYLRAHNNIAKARGERERAQNAAKRNNNGLTGTQWSPRSSDN